MLLFYAQENKTPEKADGGVVIRFCPWCWGGVEEAVRARSEELSDCGRDLVTSI
jgi:hypothetical protein